MVGTIIKPEPGGWLVLFCACTGKKKLSGTFTKK